MIKVPRVELAIAVVALEAVIEFMDRAEYHWPTEAQFEELKRATAELRDCVGERPKTRPIGIPAAFRSAFQ